MDLVEDIVLNDADGSDEDLRRYEYDHSILYMTPINDWQDDNFFVSSSEGGYSIIFDSERDNVRYSVTLSYRIDNWTIHTVYLSKGVSFDGTNPREYKSKRIVTIPGKDFPYDYKWFLELDKEGKVLPSSIQKFKRLVDRFINLGVFL